MRLDLSPHLARRGRLPERIAIVVVILVVGAVVGAALGALQPVHGTLSGMARELIDGPPDTRLPPLLLDVHFRALQTLRERRNAWEVQGLRPSPLPSAVSAGLRQGQTELDLALSLLGPAQARAPGELGRLLVEVRGEGEFAGMRAFSLEDPAEPTLARELILYDELAEAGLLAPRWEAVGLRVNGERLGTAVVVEQPSSAMLRAGKKPLGAIVGWEARLPAGDDVDTGGWLAHAQAARWSTSARGLQGTPLQVQPAWAQTRLDALRAGQLTLDEAVDVDRMARLMALAELTGLADRVLDWSSLRWYLNPLSLRLEPVVRLEPEQPGPQVRGDALLPRLLASSAIQQAFATIARAEATRLLAPNAELHVAQAFSRLWPTLEADAWRQPWLAIRQRAMRLLAADQVPWEPVPQPTPLFLPREVTDAHAALPFAIDASLPGAHALIVPAGTWHVPTTVALAEGWQLALAPGATLKFGPGAWLVLHGELDVAGTAEAPVALAAEGTQAWGGVAMLGKYPSKIKNLRVSGASGQGRDVWQPGAVLVWLDGVTQVADLAVTGVPGQSAGLRVVGGTWSGERVTIDGVATVARCSGGAAVVLDGTARACLDPQEAAR